MKRHLLPLRHTKALALFLAVAALAFGSIILARARKTPVEPELRPKTVPSSYPRPAPTNRAMWVLVQRSGEGG